jgi:hypothetical protein
VLLTRSPLSPFPKEWFSLDLHVLSAPPAFVLSQDQTLREDWFAGICPASRTPAIFIFELVLKVSPRTNYEVTGFLDLNCISCRKRPHANAGLLRAVSTAEDLDVFTLLSFQRPVLLGAVTQKKPLFRAEASIEAGTVVSGFARRPPNCLGCRDFLAPPGWAAEE